MRGIPLLGRRGVLTLLAVAAVCAAAGALAAGAAPGDAHAPPPAPVQFAPGDDAGPDALSRYVPGYTLHPSGAGLAVTVRGVPEATLQVDSLFKLQNTEDVDRTVTLFAPAVTSARVSAYALTVHDAAGNPVVTLDLTASAPSATFPLPAGATHAVAVTLTLAAGAGAQDVGAPVALQLATT